LVDSFFDETDDRLSAGRRKRRRDLFLWIVFFIVPPMRGAMIGPLPMREEDGARGV
jgi:hypothetical protein